MEYWAAITMGLLGSLHCAGMCGPIAFALPLNRESNWSVWSGSFLYNIGRLSTYFFLGIVLGFLGKGIAFAGWQQALSIIVGLGMILAIVLPFLVQKKVLHFSALQLFIGKVKGELGKRLGKSSYQNLFLIGVLNGFLPCGLVYMALAGAIAMAAPLEGGFFMLLFGVGTLPLMWAVALLGNRLRWGFRKYLRRAVPVFIIAIGSLFILRGMNLGIPYVSPKVSEEKVMSCH